MSDAVIASRDEPWRSRGARVAFACAMATMVAPSLARAQAADVPYVPTPMNVVEAMLELAHVGAGDFVIDLGSGDGRIVIAAAKQRGARGFGVDLDGALVAQAQREAKRQGVSDRVAFYTRNLFITDVAQATVVTSYLFPQVNIELRPRLLKELKPGTRVVSHDFDFGNWQPDAHVRVSVPNKPYGAPASDVYLWIIPANAAGRWTWRSAIDHASVEFEIAIEQTFQMLTGSARAADRPAHVEQLSLNGDTIALTVAFEANGRAIRQTLTGRVAGDSIRGTSRIDGVPDVAWSATRVVRGAMHVEAAADRAVREVATSAFPYAVRPALTVE